MIYLLLSVVLTTAVFMMLKEFERFQLDNFQTILANYFTAFAFGYWFSEGELPVFNFVTQPWSIGAMVIAFIFIVVFNVMAITAQKGGLSVVSVASKMSVVIPIASGIYLYNESVGALKIVGILLALVGVLLTSIKRREKGIKNEYWYLPLIIFIGGGVADTLLKYTQVTFVPSNQMDLFTTSIFLFAGCIGSLVFVYLLLTKQKKIDVRSLVGGVVLGLPNYFSIYYMIKALAVDTIETSLIFTANNLLIVMLSAIVGVLVYKEKLHRHNYLGLFLSVLSIVVFYFSLR